MIESHTRGFFASLYDFSFRSFITPKIIRIVYIIALLIVALYSIGFFISGFATSYGLFNSSGPTFTGIVFHTVGAVVIFILGSISARMYLEFIMAVFAIAENTAPKQSD